MRLRNFVHLLIVFSMFLSMLPGTAWLASASNQRKPITTETLQTSANTILLTDAGFDPALLSVQIGEQVTWQNATNEEHILRSGVPLATFLPFASKQAGITQLGIPAPFLQTDSAFDPALPTLHSASTPDALPEDIRVVLPPGAIYTHTFSSYGDFPFYLEDAMHLRCRVHTGYALDAPPLDPTVPTDFYIATEFLYTGENPIQTGVTPGTIEPARVAVLRGRVLDKDNLPLTGVVITVLDHPEYGQTLSREDGMFDLAVNGGGPLTIQYSKDGYLPVQRPMDPAWRDYDWLPEVVLIPLDPVVSEIDLEQTSADFSLAQGSEITDERGTRQATLLFPQGVQAEMVLPDGSTQPLTSLDVRITEYTVGENGPETMPAPLPPQVGYTYAIELSVDEALEAGASTVTFNEPLIHYTDNFLEFPAGTSVPVGIYDRETALWVPSESGVVIKIVSITTGLADLDIDGDDLIDDTAELAAWGITPAEQAKLASLYPAGQSLWRITIEHFTPVDCNLGVRCVDGICPPPDIDDPEKPLEDKSCQKEGGSYIECQSQVLGESLELTGTPYSLNYLSSRTTGYRAAYTLEIPLTGTTVIPQLQGVVLVIEIAGQTIMKGFPADPNLTYLFTWNNLDAYDRKLNGTHPVLVSIGYVYKAEYSSTTTFGDYSSSSLSIPAMELIRWKYWRGSLGEWDSLGQGIAGWNISAQHVYDPSGRTVYLGTGERRNQVTIGPSIDTIVGKYPTACVDECPAIEVHLDSPFGIVAAANGGYYIAEAGLHTIRYVDPQGIMHTVAGSFTAGFYGDGGLATDARLNSPRDVALGLDGSLYIADTLNSRIRRVGLDGIITTVAGGGDPDYIDWGDGGPATEAWLSEPSGVAIGLDGSLYIADLGHNAIRRVNPVGIISTIAGVGYQLYNGDNIPAVEAGLSQPHAVDIGPDGSLYIADSANRRIRRIGLDGIITTVAGDGIADYSGDGGLATEASLYYPQDVVISPDGELFICDNLKFVVRMVDRDGIITTFAGSGTPGWAGDGGLATRAYLYTPNGLALTPDGALLITELTITHVRKVAPQYPGFSLSELVLPSEDGSELYIFQYSGRHLRTLNALTGATLLEFAYDDAGLLVSMTDGDGNLTQLERDTEGRLTGFLSPYGQRTQVTLDDQGYLASLTNPASETISVHATPLGLISSLTDARGASSFYTYDEFGRLVQVADRNGAVQTLVRTQLEASDTIRGGYQVALTSALGRTTTYRVERLRTRETRLTVTFPNGLSNVFSEFKDGSTRLHFADGTIIAQVLGPDPRWGMLAPFVEQMTLKVSSDLQAVVESSREALLSDPADPSSMQTLTETISLNGHTSTLIYAAASQAFTATTSEGRSLVTTIDAQGRPLSEQYGDLLPFVYTYDARGRLETITQGSAEDERRLVVTYEPSGFPDTITDPLGQVTAFDYDLAGRLIQETLPAERVVSFIYDDNGNLASLTPPSQPEHAFTYSPLDLVEAYLPPPLGAGSDQTLYAYNPDRQLTSVTRPDLAQVKLGYDSGGRLASITIPRGTTTLEYNLITGSLQRLTAPDGGEVVLTYDGYLLNGESWFGDILGSVDFVYNSDLRLSSLSLNNTDTISYTYDGDSLPIQVGDLSLIYAPATGLLAHTTLSGVTDGWAYNTFGEQSLYTASFNSTLLYQTRFTRDRLGRITQQQETLQGKTTTYDYSYDQAGQLWQVRQDGVLVSTYLYDPNGNRLSYTSPSGTLSATYDDQDRLLTYGDASYTYTANGELLTKTEAGKTTHYTYDELGNLIQVSLPDGTQIEYLIDGLNRPIGKRVDGSLVQGFLYQDNLKPIAELDGDGNIVSRFVYATHLNVPDYMIRGGVTYRILTDHLGSPRLVVNAATGAIAQRMDFDEFGNVLLDTNPGFQPFGFAGGISDLNTGLIRFGERDYDANVGRWNSKDPIGFIAGDTDLYAYVWNNPVNVFDPSGMDCSGRVTNVEGQVFMSAAPSYCEGKPVPSGVIYVEVKEGDLISGGTTFITGRRSRLTFVLQDGAQVAIGGKQSFNFKCTAGSEKPLPQPQLIHWLRGFLDYIIMGSEEKSKPPERGMWGGGVRG